MVLGRKQKQKRLLLFLMFLPLLLRLIEILELAQGKISGDSGAVPSEVVTVFVVVVKDDPFGKMIIALIPMKTAKPTLEIAGDQIVAVAARCHLPTHEV